MFPSCYECLFTEEFVIFSISDLSYTSGKHYLGNKSRRLSDYWRQSVESFISQGIGDNYKDIILNGHLHSNFFLPSA